MVEEIQEEDAELSFEILKRISVAHMPQISKKDGNLTCNKLKTTKEKWVRGFISSYKWHDRRFNPNSNEEFKIHPDDLFVRPKYASELRGAQALFFFKKKKNLFWGKGEA